MPDKVRPAINYDTRKYELMDEDGFRIETNDYTFNYDETAFKDDEDEPEEVYTAPVYPKGTAYRIFATTVIGILLLALCAVFFAISIQLMNSKDTGVIGAGILIVDILATIYVIKDTVKSYVAIYKDKKKADGH